MAEFSSANSHVISVETLQLRLVPSKAMNTFLTALCYIYTTIIRD
jgi:hypothetical protein